MVLTCYCCLLVPVSEPAPLPEEVRPAVDRGTTSPVPAPAGGAWGQQQKALDSERPTEALPKPGLLGTRPLFLFHRYQKWGPGSPRHPLPGVVGTRRPGSWSDSAPGVGDTPSTLQEEWLLWGHLLWLRF